MIEYILFIIGIFLLVKGAQYLIEGSSSLARKFKISTLVIGLTVVAFGTSLPELVVNALAALKGNGDIALGNIIGSNIANILLILGISASISKIKIQHSTVWKEIPFSLLAALVILIFATTAYLDSFALDSIFRFEGLILLLFGIIFFYYVFELAKRSRTQEEYSEIKIKNHSPLKIFLYILAGLIALYFGGKWVVEGAIVLARVLGMSEYFISLTIVAVGTSLPELMTAIISLIKGDSDLAAGNVVGSNILNIFLVLGICALITPIKFSIFAVVDLTVLLIATVLLFLFMFLGKKHELERWQGILFMLGYIAYIWYLITRG